MFSNIFPVELEFENFTVLRLPYSEDSLKELREKYNSTHSFFKDNNHIYISNKSGEELNIGGNYTYNIYDEPDITVKLLRHIFFKTFLEKFDRVPLDFHPFRILSTKEGDDWIYTIIPKELRNKLGYKKLIELQFQYLQIGNKERFCLVANIERKWVFRIDCKELIELGFDPTGYEVVHSEPIPGLQNVLAPDEEFVGIIKSIENEKARVETSNGDVGMNLNQLFLRKTSDNIKSFLDKICGERQTETIFAKIKQEKQEYLKHKRLWEELKKIVESFAFTIPKLADEKILYLNKDGFAFTINNVPISFENTFTLKTPTFVFDKAGVKVKDGSPDAGLSQLGPYDGNVFPIKSPKILSICHKNNRGRFTVFLQSLFNGITESNYFKKGFKGKFELHEIISDVHDITSYTLQDYIGVLNNLDSTKPDLVIIELDDTIKVADPQFYFSIKSVMLTREIPMQVVLKSKVDKYNEYILNSIALQLYAKLGGVPWVLKSSMSVDREIVIGIGHSVIRKAQFSGAEQDRVVGITTFFSSDGQYLLSNKAKDVSYDDYFEELLKNLKESFSVLQKANHWKDGDTIRLIFHIFKPIKNIEFDVVANLIQSYPNFRIQFAFVTISKVHPYLLFDEFGGKIITNYNREIKIGEFVPPRGANLKIQKYSCLVQMLGGKDVKSNLHGASNPLLIKIRIPTGDKQYKEIEPLLFTDMQYVLQQIFSFTYLSWRNYLPSEHPATMLYSELIAKQLGRLRKVEGWSADILNFNLKTKKWFL